MITHNLYHYYDIEKEELARGRDSRVFRGIRYSDNLKVAIKILKPELFQEGYNDKYMSNQRNVLRELEILAHLNHPFCLNLIDFSLNPQPIIVTPFMTNGTLLNLIRNDYKELTTQKNCSIYALCMMMNFLHKLGIYNLDLKPQKILINDDKDICIADFGLSRLIQRNEYGIFINQIIPFYNAPELLMCEDYTNAVDVYSFGVIFYQFFSIEIKFNDYKKLQRAFDFLKKISRGMRFVKPSNMSDAQYKFYIDCTNVNYMERPTFEELAEKFEKDESLWLDGVNKKEFLEYVEKCKQINQKAMENRTFFNVKSQPTVNLIRSARIAASKKSARKKPISTFFV